MSNGQRVRTRLVSAAAAAAALAATTAAYGVVQDFNRARGADGYTLTNAAGDVSGTFDGQEFQPAPSSPGISGEFWFAGAGLGQPFDLDVRAPLGQGVTNTANDHGGYMLVDYKGPAGGPFYWYGGAGNTIGAFPGLKIIGSGTPPVVPPLHQMLAYADVLVPAGKPFRYYINSPWDGQDHQLSFSGVGTGAWQTVGGALGDDPEPGGVDSPVVAIGGGVIYANDPFVTPNTVAMTVQFGAPEIVAWDDGPAGGPAVVRFDNLTLTIAAATWAGTAGGNWSTDANWAPVGGANPTAPSGRNAVATFGPSAAPQTVVLDAPVIIPWASGPGGSGGDASPFNSFYAGTVRFDSAQSYTLAGPEPLQIATTAANGVDLSGPSGLIQVVQGNHAITAPVILRRSTDIDVAGGSTLTVSGNLTVFSDNGQPVTLAKNGAGTAVVNNVRVTGSLAVNGGVLRIAPNATAAGTSFVPGTVTVAAGKLDLTDNKLVTGDALGTWNGSAYTGVSGLVDAGRGNASNAQWDGSGIVTSDTRAVNNNDLVSIGAARVSDFKGIAATATTTFSGQTVLGSDTVAMVTWGGDANLDGKINIDDYGQIDFNVSSSGSVFGWYNGDFNYDGKINIDDYGIIDFNVTAQNGIFATGGGVTDGVAAVPEPASLAALSLAAAAFVGSRRRRTR